MPSKWRRTALTIDGRKIDGTPKITNGVMAGCFMRLPSLRDGSILLLAEGAETALSTWTATGYETWASIGSIARHDPPTGRQIVVARDDDRLQSPADQGLKRSMSTWLAAGIDVVIATPWPIRHQDKTDFNDTIKEGGVEAVRARIAAALEPPYKPVIPMGHGEWSRWNGVWANVGDLALVDLCLLLSFGAGIIVDTCLVIEFVDCFAKRSGPRDGPCYFQIFPCHRAVYRAAGVPRVSGVDNAFGFVGLLFQVRLSALALAFSVPGGPFRRIFLLAFAIKGNACELAPVFDST